MYNRNEGKALAIPLAEFGNRNCSLDFVRIGIFQFSSQFCFYLYLNFCLAREFMAQSIPSVPIPPPPGICHLVGPGDGEFVRKPLPGGGALLILLQAVNAVPFSTFHLNKKYVYSDSLRYFYKEYF